ncbi:hypothetical protein Mgra_00009576 [Meloidogyne graminicola]|uniref:Uncharacterized protein n=1 Tax=Meloidogyne graminicola TaxID=189291 RepID=A0A8S9Z910_9BILA|nr:hypothetical protein Mgra_00009576 [Meloidogyne graminicola]
MDALLKVLIWYYLNYLCWFYIVKRSTSILKIFNVTSYQLLDIFVIKINFLTHKNTGSSSSENSCVRSIVVV